MKKIIILTSNELRHDFFRKFIAAEPGIMVLKSYCEVPKASIQQEIGNTEESNLRQQHLALREQTEIDFFEVFCKKITDRSNSEFIEKGQINSSEKINEIINLNPDVIIAYGCSIIDAPLINHFKDRFVNIHLGLSPYYRGSGTNFFPFINNEIQCVGVTFMHINNEIDAGAIIHQIRPEIIHGDTIHQIGNRLIKKMAAICTALILNFDDLAEPGRLIFIQPNGIIKRKILPKQPLLKCTTVFPKG
ncbi:formyltransferase family protein [Flavobacterium sp. 3HN19-14]|uniref:formyltransferase family protein n=1 Tax=Flavobacterium sp. 3HN19-14 TaxID=3448133 RepID=UPI003EE1EE0C